MTLGISWEKQLTIEVDWIKQLTVEVIQKLSKTFYFCLGNLTLANCVQWITIVEKGHQLFNDRKTVSS